LEGILNDKILSGLYVGIIVCVVVIVAILFNASTGHAIYGDYWSGPQTSINVSMWTDMTNNVTNIRDVMLPTNITMSIAVSTANITALRGNGTVVMNNGTTIPYYNLTTSYTQIVLSPQSLNFTTAGAGTYLITANIRENTTVAVPQVIVFTNYALCDANGTTIVANTERMGSRVQDTLNFSEVTRSFTWIYSNSTGMSEVGICGKINTAVPGRYGVVSDGDGRSTMTYVKLP
jgi:hypothetical protein